MRNGGTIFDQFDVHPRRLKCRDRTLTPRSGAFHSHFQLFDAKLRGFLRSLLSCTLAGKRRTFARSFKSVHAGAGPGDDISHGIGDRHNRVVERGLDMHHPIGNVLFNLFFDLLSFCHGFLTLNNK